MSRATTLTSVAQQLSLSLGISIGAIMLELASRGGAITASSFRPAFLVVGRALGHLGDPVHPARARCRRRDVRPAAAPDPVTIMRERG